MRRERKTYPRYAESRKVFIEDYLMENPCLFCGTTFTEKGLLDFHHTDPKEDDKRVSEMLHYSIKSILKEIDRCIVLCRRCHVQSHKGTKKSTKLCPACGIKKHKDKYSRSSIRPSGVQPWCGECTRSYNMARRARIKKENQNEQSNDNG